MNLFTRAKQEFDDGLGKSDILPFALVPVDGGICQNTPIRNSKGERLEEYYKWQFIYALIHSGMYAKDYIGVEVRFPKGNKTSAPLKVDAVIFDDREWLTHYQNYWATRKSAELEWLNEHILAAIEFKRGDKEIEKVITGQVKPAMNQKDPSNAFVLGMYYDTERLYLFQRRSGRFLRYDEGLNQKKDDSKIGDLSLHLPDPYFNVPNFGELKHLVYKPALIDRTNRTIGELDVIKSISTVQIQDALSNVLRTFDKHGLVNQRGYQIFIEAFALKIFDEKRNQENPAKRLEFYVTDEEAHFSSLNTKAAQSFTKRMLSIRDKAEEQYQKILRNKAISWTNENHVRGVVAVCQAFQDYSFVNSSKSDLYQLVFYNFANSFKRDESAQFLTPLPVIEFLVEIVNPRDGDKVCDPCCGIGDFLSLSYVHAQSKSEPWRLNDANIYGVDLDENMIMLATLNMLLNGDGEAKLAHKTDKGSILSKWAVGSPPHLTELNPELHRNGNWDQWFDETNLLKFDVVLTNPPFGEDRAYRPVSENDHKVIEMYETWQIARNMVDTEDAFAATHERGKNGKSKNKGVEALDLGIVFLENAYRILNAPGRFGIVLSNSIASINRWQKVRDWLMARTRIVALFDLPSNVFAETGVNTTIIVAYKPEAEDLKRLNDQGYSIFVRDVQNVGYEKRTVKRNVVFNPVYKIDEETFEIETDENGMPVKETDFPHIISEFRQWALGQEEVLQELFLREA
jgi:type I restriction enzyme M protein